MQRIDRSTITNNDAEPATEYKIDIERFDPESAYLELPEELDTKTVSYIEREIRNSYEYRSYVNYLKTELDLTRCSLLPNLDINSEKFSLEFHHYPINLFEITQIVGTAMISGCANGEKISCFDIAERVVKEHYRNNVGLIPLSKTMHDMAHNHSIIVPISKVNGNYKAFIREYHDYIPDDILDRISDAELNSESDDSVAYNNVKLEKNISHYDITYINNNDTDDGTQTEVAK